MKNSSGGLPAPDAQVWWEKAAASGNFVSPYQDAPGLANHAAPVGLATFVWKLAAIEVSFNVSPFQV